MGLQEVVFLVWLGEKLALEAAAESPDLWLRGGEVVHVRSSMGGLPSTYRIQCQLQQRLRCSATYKATCSLTEETVVVKLGPLHSHRSQAELLKLDWGAWCQVPALCSLASNQAMHGH